MTDSAEETVGSVARFSRTVPLVVAAAFFMETLDGTIVTTALPAIAATFDEPALRLTAAISVYLIAMAAFVPAAGWASDRFGARLLFAGAIAVFTLASLLCALSTSLPVFVAARLLQGAAAAFMSPVGRLIVLHATPKQRIIEAIGLTVWPGLIAPVLGPPLGGWITTYLSWQWVFLVNLPLGIGGVVLVLRLIPTQPRRAPGPFDAVGFLLTAVALGALIQGLTEIAGRGSNALLGGAAVAVGLLTGVAAARHAMTSAAPLLDMRAARVATFAFSTLTAGIVARIAINMTPFLLPLMFQIGFGLTAFASGVMLLVYMAGNLAMKSATTPILHRFGFRNVLWLNGLLSAATLAGCASISPSTPALLLYGVLFAAGLTRSMQFTSTTTLAFADVPPAARAGATTLAAMMQQLAAALAVAVAALALTAAQHLRGGDVLSVADFRAALALAASLMAIAALWSLRLPRDAGAEVTRRA